MSKSKASPAPPEGSPRIREAVEKLERHIRSSGLRPGDRYITAEQAARLVGASVMTIQRAMKLLAGRNILERRPKAGTFIGSAIAPAAETICIHFLLPEQYVTDETDHERIWPQIHGNIHGMRSVLPQLSVQFNFIANQDLGATRQIVQTSPAGVILILASRDMRAFFDQSGIPTVVAGSIEPDLHNLCWVERDQVQTGRILAGYLLKRGHRRLATVMRNVWSIGEHNLHDGISEELSSAGLGASALRVRSAPSELSAISELARGLLTGDNAPTGFICRTEFQADCVFAVATQLSLKDRVEIAVCNPTPPDSPPKYPTILPETDAIGHGRIVGRMFESMLKRATPDPRGVLVPVRLRLPGDKFTL